MVTGTWGSAGDQVTTAPWLLKYSLSRSPGADFI